MGCPHKNRWKNAYKKRWSTNVDAMPDDEKLRRMYWRRDRFFRLLAMLKGRTADKVRTVCRCVGVREQTVRCWMMNSDQSRGIGEASLRHLELELAARYDIRLPDDESTIRREPMVFYNWNRDKFVEGIDGTVELARNGDECWYPGWAAEAREEALERGWHFPHCEPE